MNIPRHPRGRGTRTVTCNGFRKVQPNLSSMPMPMSTPTSNKNEVILEPFVAAEESEFIVSSSVDAYCENDDTLDPEELAEIVEYEAELKRLATRKVRYWLNKWCSKHPLKVKDVEDFDQQVNDLLNPGGDGNAQQIRSKEVPSLKQDLPIINMVNGNQNSSTRTAAINGVHHNRPKAHIEKKAEIAVSTIRNTDADTRLGKRNIVNGFPEKITMIKETTHQHIIEDGNINNFGADTGTGGDNLIQTEIKIRGSPDLDADEFQTVHGSASDFESLKMTSADSSKCSPRKTATTNIGISKTNTNSVVPNSNSNPSLELKINGGKVNTTNTKKGINIGSSECEKKVTVNVKISLEADKSSLDEAMGRFQQSLDAFWAAVRHSEESKKRIQE